MATRAFDRANLEAFLRDCPSELVKVGNSLLLDFSRAIALLRYWSLQGREAPRERRSLCWRPL